VQIRRTSGLWYSAEYSTFSISDEVGKYRLTVAEYSEPTSDTKVSYYWHVIIRIVGILTYVGKYQLTVASYSGDIGDAMAAAAWPWWTSNGRKFSTPDSDNDSWAGGSCAAVYGSGWWLGWCSTSVVNKATGNIWWTGDPAVADVEDSRMLVKLSN